MTEGQAYQIDLDPVHLVIRLTVTAETVTVALAEDIYRHLSKTASSGGPYAAIYDLSATKRTSIATTTVRIFAHHRRRKQLVVGTEPHIFGLDRVFQMCSKAIGSEYQVVHTLEEASEIVKARPEDFTRRL